MEKKVQITKNDLKALQWIADQGAMNADQLWRSIWTAKTRRYTDRRVSQLMSLAVLEKVPQSYFRSSYFQITRKAYDILCAPNLNIPHHIPMQRLKPIELPHYSALTDLRIHLEQSGKVVSWTSDRVLALDPKFPRNRFKETHPDAIYVTKSGRRMALEFERTKKSRKRVLSKIRAYIDELMRKDRFADFVVWIVTDQAKQEAYNLASHSHNQEVFTIEEFLKEFNPAGRSPSSHS